MGLADWFSEFNKVIAVKNEATIADRSCRIARRLNSHFWDTDYEFAHRFYVGSSMALPALAAATVGTTTL